MRVGEADVRLGPTLWPLPTQLSFDTFAPILLGGDADRDTFERVRALADRAAFMPCAGDGFSIRAQSRSAACF